MPPTLSRSLAAEALGTYCLVFAGTGAIIANADGAVSHVGVALSFGLVVFIMVSALGDVSGAHLNPAVSLGLCLARRFPAQRLLPYVLAQCAGALLASLTLRALFPQHPTLGATTPSGPVHQSWVMELLLTAGLMFVILSVTTGAKEKGITAGLAIGSVIALEALFAGPISGASMNPARSLAPACVSGQWASLWVYLTAPTLGAALAIPACRLVRGPDQPANPEDPQ